MDIREYKSQPIISSSPLHRLLICHLYNPPSRSMFEVCDMKIGGKIVRMKYSERTLSMYSSSG
jgi:hypothetical protein